ncbi:MAG: Bax inhibitor-1/YccA family protein [Candidatus Thermoplasmatota archaeon]|nr:hypothetical protein [Euryarchaeota archaeon]MEC7743971.1 Bax inhibitor-1/YccA family protein [Candidatus Thermoplasmatota archaeon]
MPTLEKERLLSKAMYRSGNPALNDSTFVKEHYPNQNWWDSPESNMMTMEGVTEKTGIVLIITATVALAAAITAPYSLPLILIGILYQVFAILIMWFKHEMMANPVFVVAYAISEGLVLGGFTWIFEVGLDLPGIGIIAALLTFMILGGMLAIYRAGLIEWNRNMEIAVSSALFAIIFVYMFSIVGAITGWFEVPYIHGSGPIGIAFSLFVIGIGALCLVADFDFIERGVEMGAPKEMEWRAAFGLLVTLCWLYFEILKLLAKIAASK